MPSGARQLSQTLDLLSSNLLQCQLVLKLEPRDQQKKWRKIKCILSRETTFAFNRVRKPTSSPRTKFAVVNDPELEQHPPTRRSMAGHASSDGRQTRPRRSVTLESVWISEIVDII